MSFGFGVGDFIAIGGLIVKIVETLRGTQSEYQELIRELERYVQSPFLAPGLLLISSNHLVSRFRANWFTVYNALSAKWTSSRDGENKPSP